LHLLVQTAQVFVTEEPSTQIPSHHINGNGPHIEDDEDSSSQMPLKCIEIQAISARTQTLASVRLIMADPLEAEPWIESISKITYDGMKVILGIRIRICSFTHFPSLPLFILSIVSLHSIAFSDLIACSESSARS
jgi:hypothetical protein